MSSLVRRIQRRRYGKGSKLGVKYPDAKDLKARLARERKKENN